MARPKLPDHERKKSRTISANDSEYLAVQEFLQRLREPVKSDQINSVPLDLTLIYNAAAAHINKAFRDARANPPTVATSGYIQEVKVLKPFCIDKCKRKELCPTLRCLESEE